MTQMTNAKSLPWMEIYFRGLDTGISESANELTGIDLFIDHPDRCRQLYLGLLTGNQLLRRF